MFLALVWKVDGPWLERTVVLDRTEREPSPYHSTTPQCQKWQEGRVLQASTRVPRLSTSWLRQGSPGTASRIPCPDTPACTTGRTRNSSPPSWGLQEARKSFKSDQVRKFGTFLGTNCGPKFSDFLKKGEFCKGDLFEFFFSGTFSTRKCPPCPLLSTTDFKDPPGGANTSIYACIKRASSHNAGLSGKIINDYTANTSILKTQFLLTRLIQAYMLVLAW